MRNLNCSSLLAGAISFDHADGSRDLRRAQITLQIEITEDRLENARAWTCHKGKCSVTFTS
jgi:hypothetical protein